MANVLTDLAADIYKAADVVGRELTGIIPSVTINGDGSTRAALNDPVRSHFTRAATVNETYAPSMTIPEGTDQTVDNKTLIIDKFASVQIPWTGEDMRHVNNGSGFETIYGDQIKQAIRALANKIETYMWVKIYTASSRAYGTAGTAPFASAFNEIPQIRKILADNGCPVDDGQLSLVMDTTAGARLRSLAQLQKANEAGGTELLRQGTLLDLQNFMLKESAAIGVHTKGTGAGYVTNGALATGIEDFVVDTGTGTILAGDIITYAADATNKYVVNTALTGGTDFSIGEPGTLVAVPDGNAITVGANYTPNVAFHRSAVELAIRPPAMPQGGDAAVDVMLVQDPRSGLSFEIAAYKGYMKSMFEVRCVYGGKAWKSQHIATLLG